MCEIILYHLRSLICIGRFDSRREHSFRTKEVLNTLVCPLL